MLLGEFLPVEAAKIMLDGKERWYQVATFKQLLLQKMKREAEFAPGGLVWQVYDEKEPDGGIL